MMLIRHTCSVLIVASAVTFLLVAGPASREASAQDTPVEERGKAVFDYWCATCHSAGPGMAGTQSLQAKYNGALPAALEEREDLTPELVKTFVREGILMMAPFRKTEITDSELEALAAYLSN